VTNERNRRLSWPDRRTAGVETSRVLPISADRSNGASNLATQARAGNISSDTRAGA
jgi:hypothetical protein